MNEIILIKNGELALKGLNRKSFEETLAKNIQKAVAPFGGVKVWRSQSTMFDKRFNWEHFVHDVRDAA